MKKFFTLIAAVALAASVNAQTFKSFEKTTVFITNQENVTAGIAEGWIAEGSGKTATTKTGSINPETGEEEIYKQPGLDLKKNNDAKAFSIYVTGLTNLTAYGATTSSSDTRDLYVVATPMMVALLLRLVLLLSLMLLQLHLLNWMLLRNIQ